MDKTEKLIDWEENERKDRNRDGIDDRIEPAIPDVTTGSQKLAERLRENNGVDPSLSGGDIARALAEAPGAERWFVGAIVRPSADSSTLESDGRRLGGDVLLVTPYGDETSQLRAIAPGRTRRLDIRFRSPADGRRRALLSGLDLLRRALAS